MPKITLGFIMILTIVCGYSILYILNIPAIEYMKTHEFTTEMIPMIAAATILLIFLIVYIGTVIHICKNYHSPRLTDEQ